MREPRDDSHQGSSAGAARPTLGALDSGGATRPLGTPPPAESASPGTSAGDGVELTTAGNPAPKADQTSRASGDTHSGARDPELAAAYAELQSLMMSDPTVMEVLQQIAELAASVLRDTSCGITLQRQGEVTTVASSDRFAAAVDEIQYGQRQGPCLQAIHDNVEIAVPDLTTDDRWGPYRIHAVTRGVRSSFSVPLTIDGQAIGAVNVYSRHRYAFTADAVARIREFAQQAQTTLTVTLRRADQTRLEGQLRAALASRANIDQAVGIIMGQRRVDSTDAFEILRQASQNENRKLTDLAADLITAYTGKPPLPPRPFVNPR